MLLVLIELFYDRILLPRNFFPHKVETVLLHKFGKAVWRGIQFCKNCLFCFHKKLPIVVFVLFYSALVLSHNLQEHVNQWLQKSSVNGLISSDDK